MTTTACTASSARIAAAALVVLTVVAVLATVGTSPRPALHELHGRITTATSAIAATASTANAYNNGIHNTTAATGSITRRATPLARRTASIPDTAPVYTGEAGGMQINMLVVPEHKLMWCRIDKVAGSTVASVANLVRARHNSTPPDAATFLLTGHSSPRIKAIMDASSIDKRYSELSRRTTVGSPILDVKSTQEVAHLMADPEWTKVVVFRDPVERFLSAFISKCELNHDATVNCVYKPPPGADFYATAWFTDFVAAARKDIDHNGGTAKLFGNVHWRKQSLYCGGLTSDSGLPYYNVRAQYRSHTFGGVVEDALQRAGVGAEVRDEVQVRVLGDPKHGAALEGSATHRTQAGSKLCKYFTSEEMVAEVASWYAEDYRAFAALGMKSGVEYYREVCGTSVAPSVSDAAPIDTSNSGGISVGVLVVPEHKLMWCRMGKVAGSTVATIINLVRARHPSTPPDAATFLLTGHKSPRIKAIMDARHADDRFSELRRRTTVGSPILDVNTTQEVAHLMVDPAWTKVVVFRDPVERLLSSYIAKCEPNHDRVGNCVYMSAAARGHKHVSFPDFVEAARQDIATNGGNARLFKNGHWRLQSLHCGGLTNDTGLPYYNVRAQYRSHTFGSIVEDALQRAGVPAEVRDEVQVSVLGDPKRGVELQAGATHITNAGSKLCKYFRSEEEVAEVASWYAEDYRAFAALGLKSGVEYYREVCGTSV